YFGLDKSLVSIFPNDDSLHGAKAEPQNNVKADVVLTEISGDTATFAIDDKPFTTPLQLTGVYNIYNAAAALALVRAIVSENLNQDALLQALSKVTPAFGRGETLTVNGQPLELVLVKNPSGFRLGLKSFSPNDYATMIAINV